MNDPRNMHPRELARPFTITIVGEVWGDLTPNDLANEVEAVFESYDQECIATVALLEGQN